MALPAPNLDDLRFQRDLVDEARKRIIHYCPEWTEYNLSDPGITLIELFAWMTEMLAYRINQVPEKNYIKFLEMLGLTPDPASSAMTDLTFWLSASLPISPENDQSVIVPVGMQVRSDSTDEEILFSTDRVLEIVPPKLFQLRKESDLNKNFLPRLGLEIFHPFNHPKPNQGDTFYLGFESESNICGHIIELRFTCEPTEAVGIRREDPPWVWECSLGDGKWQEIPLSSFHDEKDTTGGLNNESGRLVLYTPLEFKPQQVQGRNGFWLRCRLEQRHPSQGMYTESPRVTSIEAYSLGATVPAKHAVVVENEFLGKSSGEPGQEFNLEHSPILDLTEGEHLLVEEFRTGEVVFVPWQFVTDFSNSSQHDRHFSLDMVNGKILLGPSVRQSDGSVRQYGRIPDSGRNISFSRYRFGGGVKGNLPVNSIRTLTTSVAYIARVTNLKRSSGGRDAEKLDEVKLRAQRELQAQKRAVTIQDYEQLVMNFSRSIGRVKCLNPSLESMRDNLGVVDIMVVPSVQDSLQVNDLSRLWLAESFKKEIVNYLDRFRLLTTTVRVREPGFVGIKVKANIVAEEFSDPLTVNLRVNQHLKNFLNPLLVYPDLEEKEHLLESGWVGWPFGRDLFIAEIFALIQRVPGVRYVLDVDLYKMDLDKDTLKTYLASPETLQKNEEKVLWIPDDAVVVSLDHEISMMDVAKVFSRNK